MVTLVFLLFSEKEVIAKTKEKSKRINFIGFEFNYF